MGLLKSFMRKVALAAAVLVGRNVLSKTENKQNASAPAAKANAKPRAPAKKRSTTSAKTKASKPATATAAKPKAEDKPKAAAKPRASNNRP